MKSQEDISVECQPPAFPIVMTSVNMSGGGRLPVQLGQALYPGGRVSVYGEVHYIMGTDRQTRLKTLPWRAVVKVELESGILG